MLHNLIQTRRGKETIMMTDELPKVRQRMKTLKQSQRKGIKGDKVTYKIVPTDETDKFRRKPYSEAWRAGGYGDNPPKN